MKTKNPPAPKALVDMKIGGIYVYDKISTVTTNNLACFF